MTEVAESTAPAPSVSDVPPFAPRRQVLRALASAAAELSILNVTGGTPIERYRARCRLGDALENASPDEYLYAYWLAAPDSRGAFNPAVGQGLLDRNTPEGVCELRTAVGKLARAVELAASPHATPVDVRQVDRRTDDLRLAIRFTTPQALVYALQREWVCPFEMRARLRAVGDAVAQEEPHGGRAIPYLGGGMAATTLEAPHRPMTLDEYRALFPDVSPDMD